MPLKTIHESPLLRESHFLNSLFNYNKFTQQRSGSGHGTQIIRFLKTADLLSLI